MKKSILAALALTACGGAVSTGNSGNCAVTVSGSETGNSACSSGNAQASFSSQNNVSTVVIVAQVAGGTVNISWQIGGQLSAGTFGNTITSNGEMGGVLILQGSSQWGSASSTSSGSIAGQGTWTATLTSVSTTSPPAGSYYAVHGSFDSTAPAVPGSNTSGTVTVHATF
jgi:hypothetical protein